MKKQNSFCQRGGDAQKLAKSRTGARRWRGHGEETGGGREGWGEEAQTSKKFGFFWANSKAKTVFTWPSAAITNKINEPLDAKSTHKMMRFLELFAEDYFAHQCVRANRKN